MDIKELTKIMEKKLIDIKNFYGINIKDVYVISDTLFVNVENLATVSPHNNNLEVIKNNKQSLIKKNNIINDLLGIDEVIFVDFEQHITFQQFQLKLIHSFNKDSEFGVISLLDEMSL